MNKSKKIISLYLILQMVVSCIIWSTTFTSFAASTNFTISVSSSEIQKGDSVTVTVTLSCSDVVGAYSYCLSYDSSILEYSSGSGYGGGGTITYAGYGDGSATSASASYTFTATGTGSAYISTNSADVYTWSEETCSVSNAGVTVNVGAIEKATEAPTEEATEAPTEEVTEAPTEEITEAPTEEVTEALTEATEAPTEEVTEAPTEEITEAPTEATTEEISNNCFLSSLEITPGTLEPDFDKETYTYKTSVSGETTSLAINAIAEDSKSSVSIDGNSDFVPGTTNKVTITVTAETGDKLTYEINVECAEVVDTRVVINVDGTDMYFAQDYSHINIPEGFSEAKADINDGQVTLFVSPNQLIKCAYLTDKEGENGSWYIIDVRSVTATPLIQKYSTYNYYIILTPDETVAIPTGYSSFQYDIKKNTIVTAYRKNDSDDIILIYAMNPSTESGWYLYDTVEKTFIRYSADIMETAVTNNNNSSDFFDTHKNAIIIAALIILFIMVIVVIILGRTIFSMTKAASDENDDDTNEMDDIDPFSNNIIDNSNTPELHDEADNINNPELHDEVDNSNTPELHDEADNNNIPELHDEADNSNNPELHDEADNSNTPELHDEADNSNNTELHDGNDNIVTENTDNIEDNNIYQDNDDSEIQEVEAEDTIDTNEDVQTLSEDSSDSDIETQDDNNDSSDSDTEIQDDNNDSSDSDTEIQDDNNDFSDSDTEIQDDNENIKNGNIDFNNFNIDLEQINNSYHPTMNTADLSEVLNMAANIVKQEEAKSTASANDNKNANNTDVDKIINETSDSANKNEKAGLQFKAIKSVKPADDNFLDE